MKASKKIQTVGILGNGEIGSSIARIVKESGYLVLVKDLNIDEISGKHIDFLHINIPEKNNRKFLKITCDIILQYKPKLTIVNSSVTPGTTKKIFEITQLPIVHSPVIGVHPYLYESIKNHFPKIIGPVNNDSLKLAKSHFKKLGLRYEVYNDSTTTESAKLIDLIYYGWNIIFCKWVKEISDQHNIDFDQVYTKHNEIYNLGYTKIRPNVIRPILKPTPGPIGGHCTVEDTVLFHKFSKNRFTKFILDEQKRYLKNSKG